jgi:hypothetical protein
MGIGHQTLLFSLVTNLGRDITMNIVNFDNKRFTRQNVTSLIHQILNGMRLQDVTDQSLPKISKGNHQMQFFHDCLRNG